MASKDAGDVGLSVFLLARSLETGGAEHQMVELAIGLKKRGHLVRIGVFYDGGALTRKVRGAGIEIVDLGKSGRWDFLRFASRTISALRRARPDIIYSFVGGANIVAALTRPFAPGAKLVWSIRNSQFDRSVDHWLPRLGYRLETKLARLPDAIIANSLAGRSFAIGRGFPPGMIRVVQNGIDTERFRPDERIRRQRREEWKLAADDLAVGVLARLNATKGYPTFLRAAAQVAETDPKTRFFAIGGGDDRKQLEQLALELGVADRVAFTGEVDSVAALNALDIACSSSVTEGFSNAIAEAMACGLPCIVTDVGDSAAIVGDAGAVIPPSSPEALAEAIAAQIRNLRTHDPEKPRQRILDNFSVDAMVERTLAVFRSVLAD
jgi:glycosyltransferase involved in cell wall biosynthesis